MCKVIQPAIAHMSNEEIMFKDSQDNLADLSKNDFTSFQTIFYDDDKNILIMQDSVEKGTFKLAFLNSSNITNDLERNQVDVKIWSIQNLNLKDYVITKDANQRTINSDQNHLLIRGLGNKIGLVEFDASLKITNIREVEINDNSFINFGTSQYTHKINLLDNKVYILQNNLDNRQSTLFVLIWNQKKINKSQGRYSEKFKKEPKIQVYKLKDFHKDMILDRNRRQHYLIQRGEQFVVQIIGKNDLPSKFSKKNNPKIVKIVDMAYEGIEFMESGYDTFVIKNKQGQLSIIKNQKGLHILKQIPGINYLLVENSLKKLILVQKRSLIYYLYLYNQVTDLKKEVDISTDLEKQNLPHFQIFYKASKTLETLNMQKYANREIISVTGGYNGSISHNRLIVSITNDKKENKLLRVYKNFTQAYMKCSTISSKIRQNNRTNLTVTIDSVSEGFKLRNRIKFDKEPQYYQKHLNQVDYDLDESNYESLSIFNT